MGNERVIDFDECGCREKSFADFKCGCKVFAIDHADAQPVGTIMERAQEALRCYKRDYNILFQNCEHFVNLIVTGKQFSLQSNIALTLGTTAALGAGALALGGAYVIDRIKKKPKKDQK